MRPVYETSADVKRELEIARCAASFFERTLIKTPKLYPFDYCFATKNRVNAFVEVKVRDKAYNHYMISAHKVSEIVRMAALFRDVEPLLVVCWEKELQLGVANLAKCNKWCAIGGRTDREDALDVEPMVMIPIDQFQRYGISPPSWMEGVGDGRKEVAQAG